MPAYHSTFNDTNHTQVCTCSILPIKTKTRGPALPAPPDQEDIVDETIDFFRANVLFTNYEIKGGADRILVYGTLFIHLCLKKLEKVTSKTEGARVLHQTAVDSFALPGESGFPLGGMVGAPKSTDEKETLRSYLKQYREEIALRLVERVFNSDGTKNKWWILFAKRKFMNKELLR